MNEFIVLHIIDNSVVFNLSHIKRFENSATSKGSFVVLNNDESFVVDESTEEILEIIRGGK